MTFLEKLKAHVGGLIRIKTKLYWYDANNYVPDEDPRRVYLLLDALDSATFAPLHLDAMADAPAGPHGTAAVAVLISIDGAPKWIWAYESSLELVK